MSNYLSYIGLAFFGYFFGFRFTLLCNSIYKTFMEQDGASYYKLYFMILLYFYGVPGLIYLYILKKLYDVVSDYNAYLDQYHKAVSEYHRFIQYYTEEVEKNPEKASKVVEGAQKVVASYDNFKAKYALMMKELYHNYYYLTALTILDRIFYYADIANQYLDVPFRALRDYATSKVNMEKYKEMMDEYKNQLPAMGQETAPRQLEDKKVEVIEEVKEKPSSTQNMPSTPQSMPSTPQNMPSFQDIQNMEKMMENLPALKKDLENLEEMFKNMPSGPNMSPEEMKKLDEMMKNMPPPNPNDLKNFENMMRSMPDMNDFLTSLNNSGNIRTGDRPTLRRRNTSNKK